MNVKELHQRLGEMRAVMLKELDKFPAESKHASAMYVLNMLRNEVEWLGKTFPHDVDKLYEALTGNKK